MKLHRTSCWLCFPKRSLTPHNAILIEDKMAFVEAFFEETPPQKIAETIGGYHNIRCGFGEVSEECLKKGEKSLEQVYNKKSDENDATTETANQVAVDSYEEEEKPSTEAVAEDNGEVVSTEAITEQHEESIPAEVVAEESEESVPSEVVADNEEENVSAEVVAEDNGESPTEPVEEAGEEIPSAVPAVKSGRSKPRKAPDHIQKIDDIAEECVSFEQFTCKVAKWLEVGQHESYVADLFKVAAGIEKLSWTPIEKELAKKGYSNPFAMRQRTSSKVTQKLTKENIDCSFMALVEYVTKYKNYDFCPNIEAKVKQILVEMGIEDEAPELQSEITKIAISAVMVEAEHANMKDICTAAGYGEDEDAILDVKMNFSNFINKFLQRQGKEMTTADVFVSKLREAVCNGVPIC